MLDFDRAVSKDAPISNSEAQDKYMQLDNNLTSFDTNKCLYC